MYCNYLCILFGNVLRFDFEPCAVCYLRDSAQLKCVLIIIIVIIIIIHFSPHGLEQPAMTMVSLSVSLPDLDMPHSSTVQFQQDLPCDLKTFIVKESDCIPVVYGKNACQQPMNQFFPFILLTTSVQPTRVTGWSTF